MTAHQWSFVSPSAAFGPSQGTRDEGIPRLSATAGECAIMRPAGQGCAAANRASLPPQRRTFIVLEGRLSMWACVPPTPSARGLPWSCTTFSRIRRFPDPHPEVNSLVFVGQDDRSYVVIGKIQLHFLMAHARRKKPETAQLKRDFISRRPTGPAQFNVPGGLILRLSQRNAGGIDVRRQARCEGGQSPGGAMGWRVGRNAE